jgi:hypothetical protein
MTAQILYNCGASQPLSNEEINTMANSKKNLQDLMGQIKLAYDNDDSDAVMAIMAAMTKVKREIQQEEIDAEKVIREDVKSRIQEALSDTRNGDYTEGSEIVGSIKRNVSDGKFSEMTVQIINATLTGFIYEAIGVDTLEALENLKTVNSIEFKMTANGEPLQDIVFRSKGRKTTNGNGSNGRKGWVDVSGEEVSLGTAFDRVSTGEQMTELATKDGNSAQWQFKTKVVKDSGQFTKSS